MLRHAPPIPPSPSAVKWETHFTTGASSLSGKDLAVMEYIFEAGAYGFGPSGREERALQVAP